ARDRCTRCTHCRAPNTLWASSMEPIGPAQLIDINPESDALRYGDDYVGDSCARPEVLAHASGTLGTVRAPGGRGRARIRIDPRGGVRAGCHRADGSDHRSGAGGGTRVRHRSVRGLGRRTALRRLAQRGGLPDGGTWHAVLPLLGAHRGRPPGRSVVGRARRRRSTRAGRRGQGRDLYGAACRARRWQLDGADGGGRIAMDPAQFLKRSDVEWEIPRHGAMRVPAVLFASEPLIRAMDSKVYEQAVNVACLPGIV